MTTNENDDFMKEIEHLLQATGRHFSGVRLHCRHCGEPALAASVETAAAFGWTELTPMNESHYTGACMSCNQLGNKKEKTMTDWLDIGSSPPDEQCAQVGSDDYYPRARRECRAYIELLKRVLGPEPEGAHLGIRSNPHDFGSYLSVVCNFDPANQAAVDYAYLCESKGPDEWDAQAKAELHSGKEVSDGNVD